VKSVNRKLPS